MRTGMTALAAALAAALVFSPGAPPGSSPGQAWAASGIDWDNRRDAARTHAAEIKQAWAGLASWIQRRPRTGDPDGTETRGPHEWLSGPNSPGIGAGGKFSVVTQGASPWSPTDVPVWLDGWTERGLSFRFCDQWLAVFAEADLLGTDMTTVAVEGGLQIVRGGQARGVPQLGYPTVPVPSCMGTLPDGHVVLLATATDPFHWTTTRRRIEYNDWEIQDTECAAGEVGKIRYSQARPIELHPWARHPAGTTGYPLGCAVGTDLGCRDIGNEPMDMARWEADCADRRDGVFDYDDPPNGPYGDRPGVSYPAYGQCDPPDEPGRTAGDHLAGAVQTSTCRDENDTKPEPNPAQGEEFFDDLCSQAKTAGVGRDTTSTWLDRTHYSSGTANPASDPPDSACRYVAGGATQLDGCACPPNFSDAPWAGKGRKIEKIRWIWLENITGTNKVGREHLRENVHADYSTPVGRSGGYGWAQNKRRFHPNPGGGWRADCVQNSERDYSNCFRIFTVACDSAAAQALGVNQSVSYSVTQHTGYRARVVPGTTTPFLGDPNSSVEGVDWDWGNVDPQTLSGTATVTGSIEIRTWSNIPGTGERFREIYTNSCTYSTGLGADDGCNWGGMSEGGTCI